MRKSRFSHRDASFVKSHAWKGGILDTFTKPKATIGALNKNGPFITSMKSYESNSHMVVVDGLDRAGKVIIRDPYRGTRYLMEWTEFVKHWEGLTVWKVK